MAYTGIAQVKEYLGISSTTTTEDALLNGLISRAESIIDSFTGRHFEAETATRYFDSDSVDGQDLWLLGEDLLTITTLTDGEGTEIAAANYRLFPRNSSPKYRVRLDEDYSWDFTDDDSEISIAGTWGYTATPPADIEHACIRLAAFLYRQKDTSADIDRPLITGDGVTIMPGGLPQDVQKLLARYVRRIV